MDNMQESKKRKWNNSRTNHEANRLLIKKHKKVENERTIEKKQTKNAQAKKKNQETVNGL